MFQNNRVPPLDLNKIPSFNFKENKPVSLPPQSSLKRDKTEPVSVKKI
jgi:hypothetical protein